MPVRQGWLWGTLCTSSVGCTGESSVWAHPQSHSRERRGGKRFDSTTEPGGKLKAGFVYERRLMWAKQDYYGLRNNSITWARSQLESRCWDQRYTHTHDLGNKTPNGLCIQHPPNYINSIRPISAANGGVPERNTQFCFMWLSTLWFLFFRQIPPDKDNLSISSLKTTLCMCTFRNVPLPFQCFYCETHTSVKFHYKAAVLCLTVKPHFLFTGRSSNY